MLIMYLGRGSLPQTMLPSGPWPVWWGMQHRGHLGLPEGQTCSVHDKSAELSKLLAATQRQLEQAQVTAGNASVYCSRYCAPYSPCFMWMSAVAGVSCMGWQGTGSCAYSRGCRAAGAAAAGT